LRILLDDEPSSFAGVPVDATTALVTSEIFSTLYTGDAHLRTIPLLAAALPTVSDDGLTWTVRLRTGIHFQDGSLLTAADVAFSFQLLASPACAQSPDLCAAVAGALDSVEASDATTVVFHLKAPSGPFLSGPLSAAYILPKARVEASVGQTMEALAPAKDALESLYERVQTDRSDKACAAPEPPVTCSPASAISEMELALGQAGVSLPDKGQFSAADGTLDAAAYGLALLGELQAAEAAAAAGGIDQAAAALPLTDFARRPIGSGPYAFTAYTPGQQVTLTRFDGYFGGASGLTHEEVSRLPHHVRGVIVKDPEQAAAALRDGRIDWIPRLPADGYAALKSQAGLDFPTYADSGYAFIAFNVRPGRIFSDVRLRQAFTMCIDHDRTVTAATNGTGIPVYADVPPSSWAYDPTVPTYRLDTAAARRLIASAGWTPGRDGIFQKDGQRLAAQLYVRRGDAARVTFAHLAADQLKVCGISISVAEADLNAVIIPTVLHYPNDFDLYLGGWLTARDPDDSGLFSSSQISTAQNPTGGNFGGWSDADADSLLAQGRATADQEERRQIYARFQRLVHGQAPYEFLWSDTDRGAFSKRVHSVNGSIELNAPGYAWNLDTWAVTPVPGS
jgi:ABC-type transport system substrate-binding protein